MNVLVNISGTQTYDGQPPQEVRLTTAGLLYTEGEDTVIEYDETELTGMGNTRTLIRLGKGVSIERKGESSMLLIFRPGEQYLAQYVTPFGDMVLEVLTAKAEHSVHGASAQVELAYDFKLADARGRNKLSLYTSELLNQ